MYVNKILFVVKVVGGAFVLVSFLLTVGMYEMGMGSLVLPAVGGFIIMGPVLVVGHNH